MKPAATRSRASWPNTGMPATVSSRSVGPEPPIRISAGSGAVALAGLVMVPARLKPMAGNGHRFVARQRERRGARGGRGDVFARHLQRLRRNAQAQQVAVGTGPQVDRQLAGRRRVHEQQRVAGGVDGRARRVDALGRHRQQLDRDLGLRRDVRLAAPRRPSGPAAACASALYEPRNVLGSTTGSADTGSDLRLRRALDRDDVRRPWLPSNVVLSVTSWPRTMPSTSSDFGRHCAS